MGQKSFKQKYKSFVQDRYQRGEQIPLWKVYVTDDYASNTVIVAPLFFNVIYGLLWDFLFFLRSYRNAARRYNQKQESIRKQARDKYQWQRDRFN